MPPSALRFCLASPARLRSLSAGPIRRAEDLLAPGPDGHIELAAPVAHPWFRAAIAAVLGLTHSELDQVLDHDGAYPSSSTARGAAAIRIALREIDLGPLCRDIHEQLRARPDDGRLRTRSRLCDALLRSGKRLEWLVLEVLLVPRPCPPQLEGLYSAVLTSEPAGLAKALQALFGRLRGTEQRPSLTSHLGRRPGLHAERLHQVPDRFVIGILAPAPELEVEACGLPIGLAVELFRPAVVAWIARRDGVAIATREVDSDTGIAREALEDVLRSRRVVVVRTPATSRERMRSMLPVLVEGHAVRVHPLLAGPFDTTFDGTTVCVFAPVGQLAQGELEGPMRSEVRSLVTGAHLFAPGRDVILGAYLATRLPLAGQARAFVDSNEVRTAFDLGEVTWRTPAVCRIGGRRHQTTVGRVLLFEVFPACVPFERANRPMGETALKELVDEVQSLAGGAEAIAFAHRLNRWSLDAATQHGFSVGLGDMAPLPEREAAIERAQASIAETEESYQRGEITDGERYNKMIDAWMSVEQSLRDSLPATVVQSYPALTAALATSPTMLRESLLQILGFGGLAKKTSGEIVEVPVAGSLRQGRSPIEFFLAARGARQERLQELGTVQRAHHLTRLLVSVARDITVTEEDCGARDGLEFDLREHWPFARLEGRTLASCARDRLGQEVAPPGTVLSVEEIERLLRAGAANVLLRSPVTCLAPQGVCAACFGHAPARRRRPVLGARVGLAAATSIGALGVRLRERPFYIGSSNTRRPTSATAATEFGGTVRFMGLRLSAGRVGRALDEGGSVAIQSPHAEQEWFRVPQGATVLVRDGDAVAPGTELLEYDPFFIHQIAEVGGCVRYRGLVAGVTVQEVMSEVTGLANLVVVAAPKAQVELSLVDDSHRVAVLAGGRPATWTLPVGSILLVQEGAVVQPGDTLTRYPRAAETEARSSRVTTGGIRHLTETLRLTIPAWHGWATLSEVEGEASRTESAILVTPSISGIPQLDLRRVYPMRKFQYCGVHDGDFIRAGTSLVDGDRSPRDVLRILGPKAAAQELLRDLRTMFEQDNAAIPSQYLELVVSQMLAWVRVVDPGGSTFQAGEYVHRDSFAHANRLLRDRSAQAATADLAMLGIHEIPHRLGVLRALLLGHAPRRAAWAALAGLSDPLTGSLERSAVGALDQS